MSDHWAPGIGDQLAADLVAGPIADDLEVALEIGSMHSQPWDPVEVIEGHLVRMPVVVADPGRDERYARTRDLQQGRASAGARAVVADLQHVNPAQEPTLRKQGLDRHLRVTGEEGRETATAEQPDHRRIVDVALRQGGRNVSRGGIHDGEDRPGVEAQALARPCPHQLPTWLGACQPQEQWIGRVGIVATGIEDHANLVSLESGHQPGDVVLVRVGQDEDVDVPAPPGQLLPEPAQQEIWIRPPVDQHG